MVVIEILTNRYAEAECLGGGKIAGDFDAAGDLFDRVGGRECEHRGGDGGFAVGTSPQVGIGIAVSVCENWEGDVAGDVALGAGLAFSADDEAMIGGNSNTADVLDVTAEDFDACDARVEATSGDADGENHGESECDG